MGLATLNVWVHDKVDPCKISDDLWLVTVTYCNGNVVEWCGHTYFVEGAKCGHAEFQLPPGCYIVHAFQFVPPFNPFPLFHFTEHAIVVINCDQLGCVHLYTPPDRQRPGVAAREVQYLAKTEKLPPDKVEKFVAACDALLKDMPETAVDRAFDRLLQKLADTLQKSPPKPGGSSRKR
jgi:hypothetical protein